MANFSIITLDPWPLGNDLHSEVDTTVNAALTKTRQSVTFDPVFEDRLRNL